MSGEPLKSYVGLRPRFTALLLDYLVIGAYLLLLLAIANLVLSSPLASFYQALFANPVYAEFTVFLLLTLPVILFFAIQEASPQMATWGKRRIGIIVTNSRGERLRFGRSLVRSSLKFAPWELTHYLLWQIPGWPFAVRSFPVSTGVGFAVVYLLAIAYLVTIFIDGKQHRAIYDRISGSRVVLRSRPARDQ